MTPGSTQAQTPPDAAQTAAEPPSPAAGPAPAAADSPSPAAGPAPAAAESPSPAAGPAPAAAESSPPVADPAWRGLYALGAIAALVALAGTLLDIVLASVPGWEVTTTPQSIDAWMAQLHATPALGLRNLDLLNVMTIVVGLPMYVALYGALRRVRAGLALLSLVLVAVGTTVFVGNNVSLPMLELAREYASAPTGAQRLAIEAAGVGLLARGAHGGLGVFPGFLLPSLGTLFMAIAMVGSGVFGRVTALMGIVGTSLLLLYVVGAPFHLAPYGLLLGLAGLGGVLMMGWNVLVARALWRLRGRAV